MAFIYADGKTGKTIDILPSSKLTQYFNRTTIERMRNFQSLVTDINVAYFQLKKNYLLPID